MKVEKGRAGTRRGLGCLGAGLVAASVLLLVALLAGMLFVVSKRDSASASFLQPQSNSVHWDEHSRLTILLLRSDGPAGPSAAMNSIVVAAFDPRNQSLRLLSLPDNLWMTIPGYGPGRLGSAYAEGGPRTALLAAEGATRLVIPYYAVLDGATFARLVDALGGISPDMSGVARTAFHLSADRGAVHLDGPGSLHYLQALHHDPFGQDDRLRRDQDVYLAVERRAMQPQQFFQIPTIVSALGGSVQTNFPYDQVPTLAHMLLALRSTGVRQAIVDHASGSVSDYWGDGQRVVLPDWQRIGALAQHLCSCPPAAAGPGIQVLNGTDTPGLASSLATWFRQIGLRVMDVGTASSSTTAHTQVFLAPTASHAAVRQAQVAATLLQVPVVIRRVPRTSSPVLVMIGQDFQAPMQE